jgi:Gram-negative bacterial TonB protein C-terminal
VSFQGQHFTGGVFQLGAPQFGGVPEPPSRLKVRSARIPTFTVRREPSYSGWWGSLRVLCSSRARGISAPDAIFRKAMFGRRYFRGTSLSLSFVLHCVAVFLLVFVPTVLLIDAPELEFVPNRIETIYYLPPPQPKVEPRVAPAKKEAPPPAEKKAPSKGAFAAPRLAHPETAHKAPSQTAAPPVLRVTSQMKLPDVILATQLDAPPKPKFQYNPTASKPTLQARNVAALPVPSPTPSNQVPAGLTVLSTSTKQPILPIDVGPVIMSRSSSGGGGGTVEAPSIGGGSMSGGAGSALFVVTGPSIPNGAGGNGNGSGSGSVSGSPSGTGSSDFSGSGKGGSPGGTAGGTGSGGGGGNGAGGGGLLKADPLPNMVYAIPSSLAIRKNALTISAGPIGGGGLDVYQALQCGTVETVFLEMPGKNWTMEYCPLGGSASANTESVSRVVHMGHGIVPPQAESKFDFQRLPVPEIKAHKMIVLKGTLRADGSVDEVQVYQSILPLMDEAARAAFSHWKFKPAMQQGAPVAVQILVGIPVDGGKPAGTP